MTRSAEELRVGKRQVLAGEVEVKKRMETEHVRETVTLRSEDVDVQRRPVIEMRHIWTSKSPRMRSACRFTKRPLLRSGHS